MKATVEFEIPESIITKCRDKGISDEDIQEWYGDALTFIVHQNTTDEDDDRIVEHIMEGVSDE